MRGRNEIGADYDDGSDAPRRRWGRGVLKVAGAALVVSGAIGIVTLDKPISSALALLQRDDAGPSSKPSAKQKIEKQAAKPASKPAKEVHVPETEADKYPAAPAPKRTRAQQIIPEPEEPKPSSKPSPIETPTQTPKATSEPSASKSEESETEPSPTETAEDSVVRQIAGYTLRCIDKDTIWLKPTIPIIPPQLKPGESGNGQIPYNPKGYTESFELTTDWTKLVCGEDGVFTKPDLRRLPGNGADLQIDYPFQDIVGQPR